MFQIAIRVMYFLSRKMIITYETSTDVLNGFVLKIWEGESSHTYVKPFLTRTSLGGMWVGLKETVHGKIVCSIYAPHFKKSFTAPPTPSKSNKNVSCPNKLFSSPNSI